MPKARKSQISLLDTPYYHCVSRCVRRAYLCGEENGKSFEHRRYWVEDRIHVLSDVFAIDVCAYAVMSNHYHVVLKVDVERLSSWSDDEVLQRWRQLFKGNFLVDRYVSGQSLTKAELTIVEETAAVWRDRLQDISWFMRCLNESIARQANREDGVKGRFWEGRFKSQSLLDEQALLSCMMYVDLNPIRAKMHNKIETSKYTSIKKRCEQAKKTNQPNKQNQQVNALLNFAGKPRKDMPKGVPCELTTYLELIDWTGKQIKSGKRGKIEGKSASFLHQLNIEPDNWVTSVNQFSGRFSRLVGMMETLEKNWENFDIKNSMRKLSCKSLFG